MTTNKPKFTHIALSGGGFCGLVYLGILRFLKQEGYDKDIINIAGVSIGAVFAAILALDIPLEVIEGYLKEQYADEKNKVRIHLEDAFEKIMKEKGITDLDNYTRKIQDNYLGNMTFMELTKKTGKNLIIVATHLETMKPTYFSVDDTPHVMVVDAIQASMTVPLITPPKKIGNDYYTDGGVACNTMPLIFENVAKENILLLHLSMVINIDKKLIHESIFYYIMTFLSVFMENNTLLKIITDQYPYYIQYKNYALSMFPLTIVDNHITYDISNDDIDKSIEFGYEDTYKYFSSKNLI